MTDVTVTPSSGDVFADLSLKREIGDLVEFVDASGVRWRGALLDIRERVLLNGVLLSREQFTGYERAYPDAKYEMWGFVAIIAQPQAVGVLLPSLAIVEKGWWHKATRKNGRRRRSRPSRAVPPGIGA